MTKRGVVQQFWVRYPSVELKPGDKVVVRASEHDRDSEWRGTVDHVNRVGQPYVIPDPDDEWSKRRSPMYLFSEVIQKA